MDKYDLTTNYTCIYDKIPKLCFFSFFSISDLLFLQFSTEPEPEKGKSMC